MKQLFSDGGFSGEVREELGRAENQGIRNFAIRAFVIVNRIKNFFSGLTEGFGAAMERAQPAFDAFMNAVRGLGEAFGFLSSEANPEENAAQFESAGEAGATVGDKLGKFVEFITNVLANGIKIATGVIEGFKAAWVFIGPAIDFVVQVFKGLFEQIEEGIRQLGFMNEDVGESGGFWQTFGQVVGFVAGAVISGIGFFVGAIRLGLAFVIARVRAMIEVFRGVVGVIRGVVDVVAGIFTGDWQRVWDGAKQIVFSVINTMVGIISSFVEAIAGVVDAVSSVFGEDLGAADAVRDLRRSVEAGFAEGIGIEARPTGGSPVQNAGGVTAVTAATSPAVAQSRGRAVSDERLIAALRSSGAAQSEAAERIASRPINVSVDVDGESIASVTARSRRETALRTFAPLAAT